MKYVIVGVGAAGITAAKKIRQKDREGEILMVSADTQVYSRCMLHKFIAGERDEEGLDFTEKDFFEKYQISWKKGVRVVQVHSEEKEIVLDTEERVSYDKLLLANGADSFIPPVGELRKASNVYGLRNLIDAQRIVKEAGLNVSGTLL